MDLSTEDFAKSVEQLMDTPEPIEAEPVSTEQEQEPEQKSDETFEIVYKGETKKLSREEIRILLKKDFHITRI